MLKNKPNILYLASHGFAVRMLMQTHLLRRLHDAGFNVGIVTSDANDPSVKEYCKENGIKNIEFSEPPGKFQSHKELIRRYVLEDVKKNPALYEKHLRLRDLAAENKSARWRYISCSLIYQLVKIFPFLRALYRMRENSRLHSAEADALISAFEPDLVISTVPVNISEAKLLHSASVKAIKTATQILSWDNISCKGHFRKLSDYFIVWGPIMKEELIHYYKIQPKNIHETGVPHFDIHFQNKISNTRKAKTQPAYIFFAMSAPYFAPREIDIVEKISAWIDADTWPGLHFIIRPHPQNVVGNMADLNWLPRLQKLESARVKVDYPSLNENSGIHWSMKADDMQGMSNTVGNASIILNSCSTMAIDGLCYEKPVIITAFDNEEDLPWHISVKRVMEYEHYRNIVQSGAVNMVDDYQTLKEGISNYILHPETDMEARRKILYREVGAADGKATERVVLAIQKIIQVGFVKNAIIPEVKPTAKAV